MALQKNVVAQFKVLELYTPSALSQWLIVLRFQRTIIESIQTLLEITPIKIA